MSWRSVAQGPRQSGRTTAMAEAAKKIGAVLVCFSSDEARRVEREHGIKAISCRADPSHARGWGAVLFDPDAVAEIIWALDVERGRVEQQWRHTYEQQKAAFRKALAELREEITKLKASLEEAQRKSEAAQEALGEAAEVLELCDPEGHRLAITAPEDPEVRALCERIGYGAVMDSAARQWRKKPLESGGGIGAHTSGPCVGTVQTTLELVRQTMTGRG